MNKEDTKQAILGFTEFFKGITGNQDLKIPDDIAKEYGIEPNKWIPVTERLPEKDGQYLVTVKKGYMLIGLWCGIKEDWGNVIAWMPLPEPYKEDGK